VIFTDLQMLEMLLTSSQVQKVIQTGFSTAQHDELQAVILACQDIAHVPFNLYTNSVLKTIETAYIGPTNYDQPFCLFQELRPLLQQCQHIYFMSHLHSHTGLPVPLAEEMPERRLGFSINLTGRYLITSKPDHTKSFSVSTKLQGSS
jgi:hypothetical protein